MTEVTSVNQLLGLSCLPPPSLPSPALTSSHSVGKGQSVTVALHRWKVNGTGELSLSPEVTELGPGSRGEFTGYLN